MNRPTETRRSFLTVCASAAVGSALVRAAERSEAKPAPATRGVVLMTSDMTLEDWPERCARAGVNTIGLHGNQDLDKLTEFVQSDQGKNFLARCAKLEIEVEYELHAMSDLLPRSLFRDDPTLFRIDEKGDRNPDVNCNPFSAKALDIIAENAVKLAAILRPTTGRYFYWTDDGARGDCSAEGKTLSPSEQALLVENHVLSALRRQLDPKATLAHLCYHYTLTAPQKVKPAEGMFLEFAPITRDYKSSIANGEGKTRSPGTPHPDPVTNAGYLDYLDANLAVFPKETAQALEYWLDASMFSLWKRPVAKLPWNEDVCRADIAAYRQRGIGHLKTFACYIDAEYVKLHGDPQAILEQFGAAFGNRD